MLKHLVLTGTNLEISRICLGSAYFGASIPEELAFDILDCFYEQGGNLVDTAKIYSDWIPGEKSSSEKVIGRWMKTRSMRNKMTICTKGGHPNFDALRQPRLGRGELTADLDSSLQNLQTDCIDLYWLHRDDPVKEISEILDIMESFVRVGKIRYYGCSNWQPDRVRASRQIADQMKVAGFSANQLMWSLAVPNPDKITDPTIVLMQKDDFSLHLETGLPVLAFSSQAGGYYPLLAKLGDEFRGDLRERYQNEHTDMIYQYISLLAEKYHTDVSAISLAYLINQTGFTTIPIIGNSNPVGMVRSLAADAIELDFADMDFLLKHNLPF